MRLFFLSTLALSWVALAAPTSPDLQIRAQMVQISRQLGVTCSYCHRMNDLKASDMEAFKTARAHLKMVDELNQKHVRGLPKVDCFMCHQGQAKPAREVTDSARPTKSE